MKNLPKRGMKKKARTAAAAAAFCAAMTATLGTQASAKENSAKIYVNESAMLKMSGSESKVKWKTSDPKTVTVSKNGTVTGKSAGTAVVTGTKNKKTEVWKVIIRNKPVVDAGTVSVKLRTEKTLKLPNGKTAKKWRSGVGCLTADGSGKIRASKSGVFRNAVTAETKNRIYVYSVKSYPIFKKKSATIKKGDRIHMNLLGVADADAEWKTSDSGIVSIDKEGNAVGKKDGTAIVTATFKGLSASYEITVTSEVTTPRSWLLRGSGTTLVQKVNTNRGTLKFTAFNQQSYPSFGWLPSGGCATCATTTIIRAYGKRSYASADPTYVVNHANGGRKFNYFSDGILNSLRNAGVAYERVNYYPGQTSKFTAQLKKGTPMIISVRGNGSLYYHSSGHSLAALGMTDDGNVIVADSYPPFFGSLIYALSPDSLFSVMCDDACSSYQTKEVAVIK